MSSTELAVILRDFSGFFVALILLFFAGRLLPVRARWFFWTAGLAIIIYELYLRINSRNILTELDEQRALLRERKAALDNTSKSLQQEAENLALKLSNLEINAEEHIKELDELKAMSANQQIERRTRFIELEEGLQEIYLCRQALCELERRFKLSSSLIREIDRISRPT